jgi:serine/threonine-protein kinase
VTHSDQLLGSIHYMSPEQVRSPGKVDHRADLWALAAIAYRCLTGQHPFPGGGDVYSAAVSICEDPLLPPSRLTPGLALEMDHFFERALAKDPAARFQTAAELAAALAAAAGSTRAGGRDSTVEANGATDSSPVTIDSPPLYFAASRGAARDTRQELGTRESRPRSARKRFRKVLALTSLAVLGFGLMAFATAKRTAETPPAAVVGSAGNRQSDAEMAPETRSTAAAPTAQTNASLPAESLAPSATAGAGAPALESPPDDRQKPAAPHTKPSPRGVPKPQVTAPADPPAEPAWKPAATPL